jgi:hypothetical protein
MTCKVNCDTSDGLKLVSDTSGALDIQSAGVTKVSFDASGNMTTSGTIPSSALTGALPAIDGSALTGISGDVIASSLGTSNNTNGYIRFSNNLLINWVRKSSTGTQTINWALAFTNFYGCYVAGESTNNGYLRIHSAGVGSVTVGNANQNITGWVLAFGRKT